MDSRKLLTECLVALFLMSYDAYADTRCSKCGGTGKMVVISDKMASFGLKKEKKQCPICKQWFATEHRETCDRCNGNGYVKTARDRRNDSRASRVDENLEEGLSYLTPAELSLYESLGEGLKGHREPIPCQACNQTGQCLVCKGTRNFMGTPCGGCAGTGMCTTCYGQKISGWKYIEPTKEEIEQVTRRRIELILNARQRETGSTGGLSLVGSSGSPSASQTTTRTTTTRGTASETKRKEVAEKIRQKAQENFKFAMQKMESGSPEKKQSDIEDVAFSIFKFFDGLGMFGYFLAFFILLICIGLIKGIFKFIGDILDGIGSFFD